MGSAHESQMQGVRQRPVQGLGHPLRRVLGREASCRANCTLSQEGKWAGTYRRVPCHFPLQQDHVQADLALSRGKTGCTWHAKIKDLVSPSARDPVPRPQASTYTGSAKAGLRASLSSFTTCDTLQLKEGSPLPLALARGCPRPWDRLMSPDLLPHLLAFLPKLDTRWGRRG